MREVLYSPGYGAGWSTWNDSKYREDFLFDPELIKAVKAGEYIGNEYDPEPGTPLAKFVERMKEKHDEEYFCVLGARDLEVETVHGPFKIDEYDGHESFTYKEDEIWY